MTSPRLSGTGNRAHRFIHGHPCLAKPPAHTHTSPRAGGERGREGSMLFLSLYISLRPGSLPCHATVAPQKLSVCSAVGRDPVRHEVRREGGPGPRHSLTHSPRERVTFLFQKNGLGVKPCMVMPGPHHGIAILPPFVCGMSISCLFTRYTRRKVDDDRDEFVGLCKWVSWKNDAVCYTNAEPSILSCGLFRPSSLLNRSVPSGQ